MTNLLLSNQQKDFILNALIPWLQNSKYIGISEKVHTRKHIISALRCICIQGFYPDSKGTTYYLDQSDLNELRERYIHSLNNKKFSI